MSLAYELSVCHVDPDHEICWLTGTPLAADMFLFFGAALVLMSLGGFWHYKVGRF